MKNTEDNIKLLKDDLCIAQRSNKELHAILEDGTDMIILAVDNYRSCWYEKMKGVKTSLIVSTPFLLRKVIKLEIR